MIQVVYKFSVAHQITFSAASWLLTLLCKSVLGAWERMEQCITSWQYHQSRQHSTVKLKSSLPSFPSFSVEQLVKAFLLRATEVSVDTRCLSHSTSTKATKGSIHSKKKPPSNNLTIFTDGKGAETSKRPM